MMPLTARNIAIVKDHRAGMTLEAIAEKYQLSLSRVWQIVDHCKRWVEGKA